MCEDCPGKDAEAGQAFKYWRGVACAARHPTSVATSLLRAASATRSPSAKSCTAHVHHHSGSITGWHLSSLLRLPSWYWVVPVLALAPRL